MGAPVDPAVHGPDLYTPWREEPALVRARHVGREAELEAVLDSARRFAKGDQPLPIYLFGPRGIGKSHVLTLAAETLRPELAAAGVKLVVVPEDIPELRSAEALLSRILEASQGPRWTRWRQRAADSAGLTGRWVVLLEGLDRQLGAMSRNERMVLRKRLGELSLHLIATGVTLSEPLTGKGEPFYGAFASWPLDALDDAQAAALLEHLVPEERRPKRQWTARRGALVTLAGGSARALVALGRSCARDPQLWATEHLYEVIRTFTAHYQMRYRDLAPQAQQVVEVLAEAPREVSPTELAEVLDSTATQMSVQCGRLHDDGVLRRRSEGRSTLYRLAEPLFRYWLEYRTGPWDKTRVGWLGRLIEQPRPADELLGRGGYAHLLSTQLAEASEGHLHPELEHIRRAMNPAA